jgi:hypothetical protein
MALKVSGMSAPIRLRRLKFSGVSLREPCPRVGQNKKASHEINRAATNARPIGTIDFRMFTI